MTDVWQYTTDMLVSLKDRIRVESNDHLYYVLRANTGKHTIIGTINKTYDDHVKIVDVQLRENSFRLSSNDTDAEIKSKIKNLSNDILDESIIIQIEEF